MFRVLPTPKQHFFHLRNMILLKSQNINFRATGEKLPHAYLKLYIILNITHKFAQDTILSGLSFFFRRWYMIIAYCLWTQAKTQKKKRFKT